METDRSGGSVSYRRVGTPPRMKSTRLPAYQKAAHNLQVRRLRRLAVFPGTPPRAFPRTFTHARLRFTYITSARVSGCWTHSLLRSSSMRPALQYTRRYCFVTRRASTNLSTSARTALIQRESYILCVVVCCRLVRLHVRVWWQYCDTYRTRTGQQHMRQPYTRMRMVRSRRCMGSPATRVRVHIIGHARNNM